MKVSEEAATPHRLGERLASLPTLVAVRNALGSLDAYLVGGAVRDLIAGLEGFDLDVAVEAPPAEVIELAERLDPEATVHGRFGTATVKAAGTQLDLAATRSETYERPGALPSVAEASIADDLARRDFTVNAMAVPLGGEPRLIDPHGGLDDLRAGVLRVLHPESLIDDPTRALRAARYCARLGLEPDPRTLELLRAADLETVSAERVEAELRRGANEPDAVAVLRLLADWGLVEAEPDLAAAALAVLERAGWAGVADPAAVLLAAGSVRAGRFGPLDGAAGGRELASVEGARPSALAGAARGHGGVALVSARALGADGRDRYVKEWRTVRLEITGADLLEAGVERGPDVGRGLAAALAARLNGEIVGREQELETALRSARGID